MRNVGRGYYVTSLLDNMLSSFFSCGEYIYKGRKFNANKETPAGEKYLGIQMYRFYIRCTRCASEITFRTDPRNMDYVCESAAKRNAEPWRQDNEETDEQHLDRLVSGEQEEDLDPIQDLEEKAFHTQREMAVADALDHIRVNNAAMERAMSQAHVDQTVDFDRRQQEEQDRADAEEARRAFQKHAVQKPVSDRIEKSDEIDVVNDSVRSSVPSFRKSIKRKQDVATKLGLKRQR